ncbi:MAG TPA: hypothetical protein VJA18_03185, partial [Candidatus Nanoarchaeia archaeon]|nr:hypothetical protein [Candidatus Nanoarchaeia archaeon]
PTPIIVELTPASEGYRDDSYLEEDIPFEKVVRVVTDSFTQILRQHNINTLEGTIKFENSNQAFNYHYEPLPFCEADSKERYIGKITFEYYSSQEINGKKMSTLTTLTDVAPFGSADRVELFVDGTVRIPFYANYKAGWKTQQLHERLFRQVYHVLERHAQHNAAWKGFDIGAIVKDEKWQTYRLHHDFLQGLLAQEPLPWEKLRIFNPCEL